MTKKRLLSFLVFTTFLSVSFAQSYISETIQYDGETREYKIYVPAIYDGMTAVPLIFSFHGGSGTIADQIAIGDLSPFADTANFIAVYPQALPDPNDGGSANWIHKDPTTVDDVFFIDALIDSLSADYQIDQTRIYASGYSLGGEFSYEIGCRLNNRIASIAAVARTMGVYQYETCSPVHPSGILTILGTDDPISDYNGVWWGGIQYYLSAAEVHEYWINHNKCNAEPVVTPLPDIVPGDGSTVERHTWSDASGCTYVEHLKVLGGGHDWPGSFGNMDINATEEIWKFVSRYDLNGLIDCGSTSINESNIPEKIYAAYPNPFNNILTIEIDLQEVTEFTIYSIIGEKVLTGQLNSNITAIDLTSFPPNTYVLNIENQSTRLIKID